MGTAGRYNTLHRAEIPLGGVITMTPRHGPGSYTALADFITISQKINHLQEDL